MITTSVQQLFKHLNHLIGTIYEPDEARSIVLMLLENKLNLTKTQIVSGQKIISFPTTDFNNWINRLLRHEPIQYILGETEFLGRTFLVNNKVLIPRPETEELVSWVIEDTPTDAPFRILDIGTGSGCIAISLSAALPNAEVWALDISADALDLARQNATRLDARVQFGQMDFLNDLFPADFPSQFDCIVSNPPYIMEKEQQAMHPNVLQFEPHAALFVPDDDALVFYRAIGRFCHTHLAPTGKYYVEINENLASQTAAVLQAAGVTAHVRSDLFGKPRMISGGHA